MPIYQLTVLWTNSLVLCDFFFCLGYHKAKIKVFTLLSSHLEALGKVQLPKLDLVIGRRQFLWQ